MIKKYQILQLNRDHKDQLFMRYKEGVKKSWYNKVYDGEICSKGNIMATLEDLFVIFNMSFPSDFRGHSLSVSDVVYLDGKYYYCDSFGYKELTNFED